MKTSVSFLNKNYTSLAGEEVTVQGWIRANRTQKEFGFISLNDGSTLSNIQIVYDNSLADYNKIYHYNIGTALTIIGIVVLTPKNKQPYELKAKKIILEGDCPADYPIQPKRHTREFLREQSHLRVRTNLFNAVFRVRSILAYAIHEFFRKNEFLYVHTPIITANDAEGAGELFKVTAFDLKNPPQNIDFTKDFFGKPTNLTVSGQLEAETYALAFKKVYTFGPTFRAEKSNTPRHASEFWMIEPEIAFADINDIMNLSEEMIKY